MQRYDRMIEDRKLTMYAGRSGHTLVEIMIVLLLTGIIVAGSTAAFCQCLRLWRACDDEIMAAGGAMLTMQKIASGYSGKPGLRMAEYIPGTSPSTTNGGSRIDFTFEGSNYFFALDGKNVVDEKGSIIGRNVWNMSFAATNPARPGIVEVELTYYRTALFDESEIMRLETWVAMRNR